MFRYLLLISLFCFVTSNSLKAINANDIVSESSFSRFNDESSTFCVSDLMVNNNLAESYLPPGDCGNISTDSGGANGNYGNNQYITYNYCSDDPNQTVTLTFSEFSLESGWDYLDVYLGPNTSSPFLGSYTGTSLNGQVITSTNGCITLVFDSDGSVVYSGWVAEFECLTNCQEIVPVLVSTSSPQNGPNNEIQICQGETVSFVGDAQYPENETFYSQANATSVFEWDFGDGVTAVGESVDHEYSEGGVFSVSLTITDAEGCYNEEGVDLLVQVSMTPSFFGTEILDDEICLGEQNTLVGMVTPVVIELICDPVDADLVSLPDGNGVTYNSPVIVSCFNQGQTLENTNDLESICLNMEHSWLGDLEIEIECPTGQSVFLLEYPNSAGSTYLGIPNQSDSPSLFGTGWDYCFTNNPTYGTLDSNLPGSSQPAGSYASENSLAGLVGCELNGEWTISITDNQGIDNGFLFSWGVIFNPSIIPDGDFIQEVVSENWLSDSTIVSSLDNTIVVEPEAIGQQCYTYQMVDGFACVYDTTVCFNVIASSADFLLQDYCEGANNSATILGATGGTFSFNPNLDDGASIDSDTGEIFNGVGGTTYTVEYVIGNPCPDVQTHSVTVFSHNDPSFVFEDFCEGISGMPIDIATSGGIFSFSPDLFDGSSIDQTTGEIFDAVPETTYTVQYVTAGVCPDSTNVNTSVIPLDDPGFVLTDFCEGTTNVATEISTPGGIFSFLMELNDGASIDSLSGEIYNGIGRTTYEVEYETDGVCSSTELLSVSVLSLDDASFTLTDFCEDESNLATNIVTDGGTFSFEPAVYDGASINPISGEIIDGIGGNTYYVNYETNGTCPDSTIENVFVFDPPNSGLDGFVSICINEESFTLFDYLNGSPDSNGVWINPNNITVSEVFTPGVSLEGDYTYFLNGEGTCSDAESTVSVSVHELITISNIEEECLENGVEYQVSFDVEGGQLPYVVDGEEIVGNSFISSLLSAGNGYGFEIEDINSCNTEVVSGLVNCMCPASAILSGGDDICEGESTNLIIELEGNGPWTISWELDSVPQADFEVLASPFVWSVTAGGNYVLTAVFDSNCEGVVEGEAIVNVDIPVDAGVDGEVSICVNAEEFNLFDSLGGTPQEGGVWTNENQEEVDVIFDPSFELDGIYTYTLENNGVCLGDEATILIDLFDVITVSNIEEECQDNSIEYLVSFDIENGTLPYFVDGSLIDGSSFVSSFIPAGNTYTFEVTDVNGCNTETISGLENCSCPAAASIGGDIHLCANESGTILFSFEGNGPWTVEYAIDGVLQSPLFSLTDFYELEVNQAGLYNLIAVTDVNCSGEVFGEVNVFVHDLPTVNLLNDVEICAGDEAQLGVALTGQAPWNVILAVDGIEQDNPIEINDNSYSLISIESGTYSIVSIEDEFCSNTSDQTVEVVIHEIPSAILLGGGDVCNGDSVSVVIDFTGVGPWIYNYSIDEDVISDITYEDQILFYYSDEATIVLGEISNEYCSGITSGFVEINETFASQAVLSGDVQFCEGQSGFIEVQLEGAASYEFSYALNNEIIDTVSSTDSFLEIEVNEPGEYTIVEMFTNGCPGIFEGEASVIVNQLPVATIFGDITLCENTSGQLSVSLEGQAPFTIDYTLNGIQIPPIEGILDSLFFINVDGVAGVYSLVSVSDAQCAGLVYGTGEVDVTLLPLGIISGGAEICAGEEADIQIELEGEAEWEIIISNDGLVIDTVQTNLSSIDYPVFDQGTYTISTVISQGCSSVGVGFANVLVNELPSAFIFGDAAICAGDPAIIEIDLTGSPNFELAYAFNGVVQEILTVNENFYQLIVEEEGEYTLVSISDQNCSGTVSGSSDVSVADLPTASISEGFYEICSDETQFIDIDVTGEDSWDITYTIDGIVQPPISGGEDIGILADTDGVYEIISVNDVNCSNEGFGTVEITYFPPIIINLSNDESICEGEEVIISGNASGGMENGYSFSWTNGEQVLSNSTEVVSPETSTVYVYNVSDNCNIPFSDSLLITVHSNPQISLESDVPFLCEDETITTIYNSSVSNGGSCTWDIDGDFIYTCDSVVYDFDSIGSYDVGLTIVSSFGCVNSVFYPDFVQVFPSPNAKFVFTPNNPTVLENTVEFVNESTDATSFEWDFSGIENSFVENPSFEFPYSGSGLDDFLVCLSASNDFGCMSTTCHEFLMEGELIVYVPNAFTPNGDFLNDVFKPVISGGDPLIYEFSIYNRWGEKVFYSEDYKQGWSGAYLGSLRLKNNDANSYFVADGIYNWVINLKKDEASDKRKLSGKVSIIR